VAFEFTEEKNNMDAVQEKSHQRAISNSALKQRRQIREK